MLNNVTQYPKIDTSSGKPHALRPQHSVNSEISTEFGLDWRGHKLIRETIEEIVSISAKHL